MKINAFTMRYEIWKGREKKVRPKAGSNHWSIASKRHDLWFTICATGANDLGHSAVLLLVLPVPWLTDVSSSQRWVIYSQTNGTVSNLYLPLPVCLICGCVFWLVILFSDLSLFFWLYLFRLSLCFWLVILFSDLSLCFLTCYFVFGFVVVFSDLLFCFRICRCVFWLVILFSDLSLCFLTCLFVFGIVVVFSDLL